MFTYMQIGMNHLMKTLKTMTWPLSTDRVVLLLSIQTCWSLELQLSLHSFVNAKQCFLRDFVELNLQIRLC
jgi:hypothetical protein